MRRQKIAKKYYDSLLLVFKGRSRSSMLVPPESLSVLLVMINSKSVPICNRLYARRVYIGPVK